MVFTGGPLNYLNGQSRTSDPSESIHVMSVVREHDPETPDELYEELNRHHEEECECGTRGGGRVEDYGDWLYEAQIDEWGEYRFDREACRRWIYDLFVMQTMKGRNLEDKARKFFERSFDVVEVEDYADDEYRVDLIIEADGDLIAGIQVKPKSYKKVREAVKNRNREAHSEIDEPVLYLYYDYDDEEFTNAERVMSELYKLVNDD